MMLYRFLLVAFIAALFPTTSRADDDPEDSMLRWVVTFKNSALFDRVDTLLAAAGIDIPDVPLVVPELLMRVFMMDTRLAKLVADLPFVDFIELDRIVKLIDPMRNETSTSISQARQGNEVTPYGIELVQALQVDDSNIGNRKVCVIDSGYDLGHVDLPGQSVVTGSEDIGVQPWFEDDNSHGTHVTGTIAALTNGIGVRGVAASGQLPLHIVRIFDETGQSFSSNTVADVQACINAGANVVSMSFGRSDSETLPLGYGGPLEFEQRAFTKFFNEGVLLVAAAGNDGTQGKSWPASYDSVMSVAAVNENKEVASFSQSNDAVDISGPGVMVLSTIPNNQLAAYSGTSMACPHVSGVAALVWSNFPDKTAQEIWTALISSAEDLGPAGRDDSYGFGLVQAAAAMAFLSDGNSVAAPTPAPPTPTPPPAECADDETWVDRWGDDCSWYDSVFTCQAFGLLSRNDGKSAFDACCTCGGGSTAVAGGNEPTPAPSPTSDAMSLSSLSPFLALVGFVAFAFLY